MVENECSTNIIRKCSRQMYQDTIPSDRVVPDVANVGGLQIHGVKGDVVALYFELLTTRSLKFPGVPDG
jgi:hypothetical protein